MSVLAIWWCVWLPRARGDWRGKPMSRHVHLEKVGISKGTMEIRMFGLTIHWFDVAWSWQVLVPNLQFGNTQHVRWIDQVSCCVGGWKQPECWWTFSFCALVGRCCLMSGGWMRSSAHCVQSTNFYTLLWNSYVFSIGFWLFQKYEFIPSQWKFVLFGQWRLVEEM